MSTVSFGIPTAGTQSLPVGSVVSYLLLTITNPDLSTSTQHLPPLSTSATATITQVGNYTASVQAMSAANTPIGNAVTTTFALGLPTSISLVLPAAINPTVTP